MENYCEEYLIKISEYIDGELPAHHVKALEEHLYKCKKCEAFYESILKTIKLFQILDGESVLPQKTKKGLLDCFHCDDQNRL